MDEGRPGELQKKMYVMCVNLLHTKAGLEEKKKWEWRKPPIT